MFNKYHSKYPAKTFRKTSSSNKVINRQTGRICSSEVVTVVTEANLIFQLLPERILFKQHGRLKKTEASDKTTEVRGCADFSVMFAEKLNKNN